VYLLLILLFALLANLLHERFHLLPALFSGARLLAWLDAFFLLVEYLQLYLFELMCLYLLPALSFELVLCFAFSALHPGILTLPADHTVLLFFAHPKPGHSGSAGMHALQGCLNPLLHHCQLWFLILL
jgi:hypothetical protein